MRFEPGHVLAERYRLERPVGDGGMGEVWRAEHIKLRSPVAVKLLHESVAADEEKSARFLREAQAAAAIRSSNVVQVLDYGVENGVAYLAMEFLDGETLDDRIARRERMSPLETARILTQVARAIAKAHKLGIVHRDLKPSNVMIIEEDDEGEIVKVLDFGIAKLVDERFKLDGSTKTGAVLGTPHYMSPEQARGHKELDHRADLWSLGIIAFECITGERPVEGDSLGDVIFKICGKPLPRPSSRAPVPLSFDRWFERATQRDRGKRFQSAKEMARALREALLDDNVASSGQEIDDPDTFDGTLPRRSIESVDTVVGGSTDTQPAPESAASLSSDSWDSIERDLKTKTSAGAEPADGSMTGQGPTTFEPHQSMPPRARARSRGLVAAAIAAVAAAGLFLAFAGGETPSEAQGGGEAPAAPSGDSSELEPPPAEEPAVPPAETESAAAQASAAPSASHAAPAAAQLPPPAPARPRVAPPRPAKPPPPAASSAPGGKRTTIEFGI